MTAAWIRRLYQGDNRSILSHLAGVGFSCDCAYIDPPYNGQENFSHYEDNADFDVWISGVADVASLIRSVLNPAGSLWISIDDRNMHYLKICLDKIFGRENFVSTIVWEHRRSRENRAVFSNNHEYILVYAKNKDKFKLKRNKLPLTTEALNRYKNPDNDHRGVWQSVSLSVQAGHGVASQFYDLRLPNGLVYAPPRGRCWAYRSEKMHELYSDGRIYIAPRVGAVPRLKKFLSEARVGLTPHTLWKAEEVGTTADAKKHVLELIKNEEVFDTPKPESLIERIVSIATDPGDVVLDAYLGSGTTAAVAHKMGRQYIGIEIGDHIATHCVERLRRVCAGETGGVSKQHGWEGGGSFEFMNGVA